MQRWLCFDVTLRVHTLMQHANNVDALAMYSVIGDVAVYLKCPIAGADVVTRFAELRIVNKLRESCFQLVKVTVGLFFAPLLEAVAPNAFQVCLRKRGFENLNYSNLPRAWLLG